VSRSVSQQELWLQRSERGTASVIRLLVWIAMRLGRPVARALLWPICAYFLAFSPQSRTASRDYLARILGRSPHLGDLFRHYLAFAACALDRVYLLNDQLDRFDLEIHGEDIVLEALRAGDGCFLFGAHLGSFEVLRSLGRRQPGMKVSLVMYEDNARKINAVLNAINPALAMEIIALGRSSSMIGVESRLEQGHCVGLLVDRGIKGEGMVRRDFLGAPAKFPLGPFRMAALLKRPVVVMFGLYRGGRRYEIHFERLTPAGGAGVETISVDRLLDLYVGRLEHYCRQAPFNWFNFYDFWH
jgi:predicted LPLAT superfamily acyltransferase